MVLEKQAGESGHKQVSPLLTYFQQKHHGAMTTGVAGMFYSTVA